MQVATGQGLFSAVAVAVPLPPLALLGRGLGGEHSLGPLLWGLCRETETEAAEETVAGRAAHVHVAGTQESPATCTWVSVGCLLFDP